MVGLVYEDLPPKAGVHFTNRLPNSIKNALMSKALKTCLKNYLALQKISIT